MDKYRLFLFTVCLVSYGIAQIIKTELHCGRKLFSSCNKSSPFRISLECQSHHVILLTDIFLVNFNETDEKTCCARLPKHSCIADRSTDLSKSVFGILECNLKPRCFPYSVSKALHRMTSIPNKCSATSSMFHFNYICATNSTVVNMTNPGVNENIGEMSLTYNWINYPLYPRINGSFHCLCEITAGDDVIIFPTLYYLNLQTRHRNNMSIYGRNENITYDTESKSLIEVRGSSYIFHERLHHLSGPLYMVYAGEQLPSYDKLWINFKVMEGRIKARCEGCKKGRFTPPQVKGNVEIIERPHIISEINTLKNGQTDTAYRNAFISLVVLFTLTGNILMVAYIMGKKKRPRRENSRTGETTVRLNDTNRRRVRGGTEQAGSRGRRGEPGGSVPTEEALPQDHYDTLDHCHPVDVYDNIDVRVYSN